MQQRQENLSCLCLFNQRALARWSLSRCSVSTPIDTNARQGCLGCWVDLHLACADVTDSVIVPEQVVGGPRRLQVREHLNKLRYEAGDGYGDPGWTWVYPKVRLPDQRERMTAAILSFCSEGKTEEKILREFAKLGKVQVKQVVRSLAKQGKLKIVNKGVKVLYQAAG